MGISKLLRGCADKTFISGPVLVSYSAFVIMVYAHKTRSQEKVGHHYSIPMAECSEETGRLGALAARLQKGT